MGEGGTGKRGISCLAGGRPKFFRISPQMGGVSERKNRMKGISREVAENMDRRLEAGAVSAGAGVAVNRGLADGLCPWWSSR